ncbi:hypothetical protein BJ742DRAFT_774359 [Cladochytrium replicatum]|nr:hypothetical protein BJ742DRAFT_774359 [Cladochytrium replicatum]
MDIPPLEDLSAHITKLRSSSFSPTTQPVLPPPKSPKTISTSPASTKVAASFNGLRRGFLSGGLKTTTASPKDHPMKVLKPKTKTNPLELKEVQDALNNGSFGDSFEKDLLASLKSNLTISRALEDPAFAIAAGEIAEAGRSGNAQALHAVVRKWSSARPDLVDALREYSGILGHKLMTLDGGTDDSAGADESELPDHEKELVQRVLSDPLAKEMLGDPVVQKILQMSRNNPSDLNRALQNADSNTQKKIGKLVEWGILKFQ